MSILLKTAFKKLLLEVGGPTQDSYLIEKVANKKNIFVGISPEGYPAILLKIKDSPQEKYDSIDLNGIKTEFKLNCNFSLDGNDVKQSIFNIVICTDEDPNAQDFFYDFFERFFSKRKVISTSQLKKEIQFIRELFGHKKNPGLKTIMGLWSELFIIYKAKDTESWAKGWHTKPRSTFDFKFSNIGLDVKSFGGHTREHFFQLEQLTNISVEQTIILSMSLQESEDGLTVFDLFNKILPKLNNYKLIKKIENLIFKIGGQNNKEARKFNENIANNSLLLLRGREVPCISNNIPTGISEIKFKADCSHIRGLKFNKKNQDLIASSRLI
jgi:hypothetical protein